MTARSSRRSPSSGRHWEAAEIAPNATHRRSPRSRVQAVVSQGSSRGPTLVNHSVIHTTEIRRRYRACSPGASRWRRFGSVTLEGALAVALRGSILLTVPVGSGFELDAQSFNRDLRASCRTLRRVGFLFRQAQAGCRWEVRSTRG